MLKDVGRRQDLTPFFHGNPYTHIFADPDSNNVAAVKAYEKAGFKKVLEQEDTGEAWMFLTLKLQGNGL